MRRWTSVSQFFTGQDLRPIHGVVGLAVLMTIVWPLYVFAAVFLLGWVALIIWLSLGPDRASGLISGYWEKFAARSPESAEQLRICADKVALCIEAALDWLPGQWADRLALPDFSQPVGVEANYADASDPFARLKQEHHRS